jgi:hypothetical protein
LGTFVVHVGHDRADEPNDGTGTIEVLEALIDQFATAGPHVSAYPLRS